MKKTLLAAALALGFTGVAQAETSVTLYGLIDAGFGYHQQKGNVVDMATGDVVKVKARRTGLHDGTQNGQSGSRFGLRGTEDLGNGLRAEFQLEQGFNIGSGGYQQGGNRQFSRQAWIGLAGDNWGSLRFGRQHSVGTDFMLGMIDPFGGGFGLANGGDAFRAINTNRMDNSVKYVTPNFSGFQFGVAYSFNHSGGQTWKHEHEDDSNTRAFSTGIRYANGPLGVALTYDQMSNNSNNGYEDATLRQWNLGAAYDFEVVKLHAAFGQTRNGEFGGGRDSMGELESGSYLRPGTVQLFDTGFKSNSYLIGLSAPLGAGNLMASWTMVDPRNVPDRLADLGVSTSDLKKQHTYALGYTYDLSKRTNVYAYGAYKDNVDFVDDSKATSIAIGLRHRF